ncbi:arsenic resistance protein [Heliorestis acidaminivorans]|uniref:Arsenic resistance protein n=1 Tax=Heliorestis acidaminivorans TaxID=553427 RepID=A0A6I0F6D4_9FIRM|nr:arsenic resistance protein [Heliorestis acidaminivorans]KAB2952932.1 arsenic resistance protein [Heliorestis acidaminivorans]
MSIFEKLQPLFILLAIMAGLILGELTTIALPLEQIILALLLSLIYSIFLQIPIKEIGQAFKNITFTGTSLAINFIVTPLLAFTLGYLFLLDSLELRIGLLMLLVTPCTDWYLLFTALARGNLALAASILPLNLILQLLLLPFYLLLFVGELQAIDSAILLQNILLTLLLPLIGAFLTQKVIASLKKQEWFAETIKPKLGYSQLALLALAVLAMFMHQGNLLLENYALILQLLWPLLLFFVIIFLLGQVVGKAMKFSYPDRVSLNMTTLARNSPVALAIALTAFADMPLIALTLVIAPLIEIPVLAAVSQVLLWMKKKEESAYYQE